MNNDNSATYGMVALALAVFLSLVALFAAPWLARWLAESATAGYGYAYAYDYAYAYASACAYRGLRRCSPGRARRVDGGGRAA